LNLEAIELSESMDCFLPAASKFSKNIFLLLFHQYLYNKIRIIVWVEEDRAGREVAMEVGICVAI
jgi:hypothetical protein